MAAPYSLTAPGLEQLQPLLTTTGSGGILLLVGKCARLTVVMQSTGTTSGGTLTIEEAYYDPNGPVYAGTWSAVATAINASSFTGGAQLVTHIAGSFWAVRVRISANITGDGTVAVWAWGN